MTLATQRGPERQAPVIITDEVKQEQYLKIYKVAQASLEGRSFALTWSEAKYLRDCAWERLHIDPRVQASAEK